MRGLSGENMATILKQAKRASQASNRRYAVRTRLRIALALSMQRDALPGDAALKEFAAHARRYRSQVVEVTQDLSALQARNGKQATKTTPC